MHFYFGFVWVLFFFTAFSHFFCQSFSLRSLTHAPITATTHFIIENHLLFVPNIVHLFVYSSHYDWLHLGFCDCSPCPCVVCPRYVIFMEVQSVSVILPSSCWHLGPSEQLNVTCTQRMLLDDMEHMSKCANKRYLVGTSSFLEFHKAKLGQFL